MNSKNYFILFCFLNRSEEKSVDPVGYKRTSYNTHHQANTNPIAYQSDVSLNKNKIAKPSHQNGIVSSSNANNNNNSHLNGISNGIGVALNPQHQYNSNHVILAPGVNGNSENKSEDGNVSIPHIADFYPEDSSSVPADHPCTSTLFLPKAGMCIFKILIFLQPRIYKFMLNFVKLHFSFRFHQLFKRVHFFSVYNFLIS